MSSNCPFCDLIAAHHYDSRDEEVVSFEPLNPVVPGHRLFVPVQHVRSALTAPWVAAHVMHMAAGSLMPGRQGNFIWNCGESAGQTVWHAHLHWVPRAPGDGLAMPWTAQQAALALVGGER